MICFKVQRICLKGEKYIECYKLIQILKQYTVLKNNRIKFIKKIYFLCFIVTIAGSFLRLYGTLLNKTLYKLIMLVSIYFLVTHVHLGTLCHWSLSIFKIPIVLIKPVAKYHKDCQSPKIDERIIPRAP